MQKIPLIPVYKLPKYLLGFLKNPIAVLQQMAATYGDIIGFGDLNIFSSKPHKPIVLINHPNFIRHVLKDNVANYSRGELFRERKDISRLDDFLGNGIFMSDGFTWQQQHELVKPLFSAEAIQQHQNIIAQQLQLLTQEWKTATLVNTSIDVETSIHKRLLNILFYSQFVSDTTVDTTAIFNAFQKVMLGVSFHTSTNKFFQLLATQVMGSSKQPTTLKHIQALEVLVDEIIHKLLNKQLPPAALTTVLNNAYANGTITYKDYKDTVMNFLFAGFETTAAAICWALYCFAKNTNEQEKIFAELQANIPNNIADWSNKELPYLKLCTKEAMRLYPPVWLYTRQCLEDDIIEGYTIKKGTVVLITPFALHQHTQFWDNPKQFNPANFEKNNIQGKAFVYIPFGQGKRVCIGQGFANIQMQIILAQLLHTFLFTAAYTKDPAINAAIIIKGKKPLKLVVMPRNSTNL